MTTILVTGATGTIGSEVLRELAGQAGVTVRAGVRRGSKAESLPPNVQRVDFDYTEAATMAAALGGVDRAFLLAPTMQHQVEASLRFVDLAKTAGVSHVVKLSAMGCDREPGIIFGRAHRAVEKGLMGSGMAWTFLRPNNLMENFLGLRHGAFAPNPRGDIYLPWGKGACSFVSARDIAAVAARVLTVEGHAGKAYELTGPQALTMSQVADLIGEASGRVIRYVDLPEEATRKALIEARMPPPVVDAVLELHAIGKAGLTAVVTSDVEDVTGRAGLTFRQFAKEHAGSWRVGA